MTTSLACMVLMLLSTYCFKHLLQVIRYTQCFDLHLRLCVVGYVLSVKLLLCTSAALLDPRAQLASSVLVTLLVFVTPSYLRFLASGMGRKG